MTTRHQATTGGGHPYRIRSRWRHGTTGLLFIALLVAYVASPVRTSFDSRWSVHTAMSFLRGHGGALDEYAPVIAAEKHYAIARIHGRPYGFFPIGTSVLSMPVVLAASVINPGLNEYLTQHVPARFEGDVASLYGALAGVLFLLVLRERFAGSAVAAWGTAIFCFATPMWSTATRALWQHGPLVLMLTIAMLILLRARRHPSLIGYLGLPLAMAYVIRPTASVPIAVLSLYVLAVHRRWFVRYIVGAAVIALPWLAYNVWLFDTWLPAYYYPDRLAGSATIATAMLGNLVSPARGLFVFSPILLAALPGFALSLRDENERALHGAFGAIVVLHWLLVSRFGHWWGGDCFGPRLMSDILPFITYFVAFSIRAALALGDGRTRALSLGTLAAASLVSLVIHARGALSWAPYAWNASPASVDVQPSRLWDWSHPQFVAGIFTSVPMPQFGPIRSGVAPPCSKEALRSLVSVGSLGDGRACLATGWSAPERWGTWSDGPAASIEILPGPRDQPEVAWTLMATAHGLVTPAAPHDDVDVLAGETWLARWNLAAGDQAFSVRIPAAVRQPGGKLKIVLRPTHPRSPAELGLSADGRHLGIGLVCLGLRPKT